MLVAVPSEGHLKSATNSPIKRLQKISCSSQVNNNYSNLDMESLEDMLRKVDQNFKLFSLNCPDLCSTKPQLLLTWHSNVLHFVEYFLITMLNFKICSQSSPMYEKKVELHKE